MNPLEEAVLRTVAYADVFSYPLTPLQVEHYLIGLAAPADAIHAALDRLAGSWNVSKAPLCCEEGYVFLAGRGEILDLRRARMQQAAHLWPRARIYAHWMQRLPFVRMLAVTGALAVDNEPGSDIDFLVVTEPGRLWLCRGLLMLLVHLGRRYGDELCPNYLVTLNALSFHPDLYTAHELFQMQPLFGQACYRRILELNVWAETYLPNVVVDRAGQTWPGQSALQRLSESLLSNPAGERLERWEMQRKIARLSFRDPHAPEADFSPDWCKGHFGGYGRRTLQAYQTRLNQLGDRMTDILLGHSYFLRFDHKLWQASQPYPPLGTLYAAAMLRQAGNEVALFDAMLAESESDWAAALERHRPRLAVLFEDNFNYLSKMCLLRMRQAALTMIGMARQAGCIVIVAGADPSDHPELYLRQGANYVLLGEGDATLVDLVDELGDFSLRGEVTPRLARIPGLAWLEANQLVNSGRRPDLTDLDQLPFPAWDLVDMDRYRQVWLSRHGYFALNLVTTRGCPFHCNWCAKPIWGQRYHSRSPENVVAEMAMLHECYRPDYLWFMDDIFGLKPGWTQGFARQVDMAGMRVPFKCLDRADLILRDGEIEALSQAGADIVWIGAESGSQQVLDAMEKGTRVEQIGQAAAGLHAAGLRVAFFLQFGYPGETRADIEQTLTMLRDLQPDDIGVSVSYPLPGTKFYQAVRDQLGVKQNWYDSQDLAMLYHGPFNTAFYRQLHRVVHAQFRGDRARKAAFTHNPTLQIFNSREAAHFPKNSRLYNLVKWIYYRGSLPLERRRLERLANRPHRGISPLKERMSQEKAATPTPQE